MGKKKSKEKNQDWQKESGFLLNSPTIFDTAAEEERK